MVKKKILVVVVLILILGLIVGGGVLAYRSIGGKAKISIPSLKPTPTSSPTPTSIPSPTPVDINFSDYKIQVLNGSGVVGEAGVIRDLLEKEGAKDVATDNADSYDHAKTEIKLKKEVGEKVFTKLKEILVDYAVIKGDILPKTSSYDIVITIGTKKTKE